MTKRDFATTFGLGMLIGLWVVGALSLLSLVAGCAADVDAPVIDATVVPPIGARESSVITSPVTNCSAPLWWHNIKRDSIITQRINSPSSCPGEYYWGTEPSGWRIASNASAPVRADGHGACTWVGAPSIYSSGCVWERQFTCPYTAANGGTFLYTATVIAQDVNWWGTTLRMHVSSHSGTCARLVTAKFDL